MNKTFFSLFFCSFTATGSSKHFLKVGICCYITMVALNVIVVTVKIYFNSLFVVTVLIKKIKKKFKYHILKQLSQIWRKNKVKTMCVNFNWNRWSKYNTNIYILICNQGWLTSEFEINVTLIWRWNFTDQRIEEKNHAIQNKAMS